MPRISTYTPDTNVTKNDKLIGTDAGGGTKNFLIEDISRFIKETNAAGIAGQFNFKYKTSNHTNGCSCCINYVHDFLGFGYFFRLDCLISHRLRGLHALVRCTRLLGL